MKQVREGIETFLCEADSIRENVETTESLNFILLHVYQVTFKRLFYIFCQQLRLNPTTRDLMSNHSIQRMFFLRQCAFCLLKLLVIDLRLEIFAQIRLNLPTEKDLILAILIKVGLRLGFEFQLSEYLHSVLLFIYDFGQTLIDRLLQH